LEDSLREEITFRGHLNVLGTHRTTFEITKEISLSTKGNCIIGVAAKKSGMNFKPSFRKKLADDNTLVLMKITVDNDILIVNAKGHHDITLTNPTDLVVRKSTFVCPRTLAISADKASIDIPRSIINRMKNPNVNGSLEIVLK